MKSLLLWALSLCLLTSVHATTYYFSASGNDSYSATQATNQSTPWKSIDKLNAIWSTLQPGDVVLFKRGDSFYGTIKPTKSGTASAPITIGAYGSGNKPVITGFVTLNNWVSVGSGKYESYNASLGSAVNVVSFNGNNQEMGRYPNSNTTNGGYLKFESHGTNSITDNELTSATNWTGAELVVRSSRYTIDRTQITSHSSTTLSYSPALTYAPTNNFGYFIQKDIRTLDQLGEWYYNSSSKKMTVYFGSSTPSAYPVQASTLDRLVDINNFDYIIVDNLALSGANEKAISVNSADYVQIKNCDISFSNQQAIYASGTQKFLAENNTINHTQSVAISISGSSSYAVVKGNKISNTGLLQGMGLNGQSKSIGIYEYGTNNVIEGNSIENTGYNGISFFGNTALIKNNNISKYNLTKDDGAGIYTVNAEGRVTTGQKVIGNIVLDGIGAAGGTNYSTANYTKGIYMDDRSTNVEIANNTVARNNNAGVFLHNCSGMNLHDNLLYDNAKTQLLMQYDNLQPNYPLRNMTIKNNTLVAQTAAQSVLSIKTLRSDIDSMGSFDNNTYSCPLDKDGYFITTSTNTSSTAVNQVHDLKSWQNVYKKDPNARVSAAYVQPHKLNALLGSNRYTNGGFDANITGLNAYTASSSSTYTKSWVASKLDAGTFQGTLSSSTPDLYTTTTSVGAVTAGKKYLVKFTAQSSRDTSMKVYFRQSASPYNVLSNDGVKNMVKITTGRREYEFVYVPKASEANTVLFMEANARSQSFWLDNIKIYEADATLTNPEDSIKFVYNTEATTQTVSLSGSYVDPLGKSYSSSITLAPYTSAVLVKTGAGTQPPATNQAPTVAITSPTADSSFTAPATIRLTASASDTDGSISKVEFYRDSTLITTEKEAPYDWTWSNVAAGSYTITAKAYDNAGNVTTSAPVSITVKAANQAPSVAITSPTANTSFTAPASVRLTATATDADGSISKFEFYNDTTLLTTVSAAPYDWTWSNVTAGTYTITAKAYDNSGEVTTSAPVSITVNPGVANQLPSVSLTSPTANATFQAPGSVRLTATATDADGSISKVEFYNGSTLIQTEKTAPYDWTWSNVAAGTYSITAKAYDNNGEVTTTAPVSITVKAANQAPSVAITSPTANATFQAPGSVRLTATATDADGSISKVEFYNGSTLITTEKEAPYDWTWSNVAAGSYTITAKAYDNAGNVTTTAAVSITVKAANQAPSVAITSPTANATYKAPASVRLTATATDADGSISKVEFYRGTTLITTEKEAPYDWTWSNVAVGTYTITAKAYDNAGNVTTSAPVTITVNKTGKVAMAMPTDNSMTMSTEATFRLYPNPASSSIYVDLGGMTSNQQAKLTIYNMAGSAVKTMKVTLSGSNIKVDISTIPPGAYLLSLSGEGFNKTQKFQKVD